MTNSQTKVLLLGKCGQVGWELQRVLASSAIVHAVDYPSVDFTSADSLRSAVTDAQPDIIINAAAYTAVDQAEAEKDLAISINATAPGILAEAAKASGALLVHYSTDYVFDGKKSQPYTEDDLPCPLNVYGRSKLEGDQAVQAVGGAYLIFRLSWVYSWRGKNFFRTMLKLGSEKNELVVVDDQIGSPTVARCIAQATGQVLSQAWKSNHGNSKRTAAEMYALSGVYNLTCAGFVSWHGFAKAILESEVAQKINCRIPAVLPIPHTEYRCLAERPANSRLSNQKIRDVFGIRMPEWQEALKLTLEDIAEASSLNDPMPRR